MFLLLILNLYVHPAQDQAERLYGNALTFMNAGKYTEALADFNTVIASFGDTEYAPRALLHVATYYLEKAEDVPQALTYLNKLQTEHADSEEAPAAYYYKAQIASSQGSSPADLEAATADLVRMNNLYPKNRWRDASLFLFGSLSLRLGNYKQCRSYFQRLEFLEPNSTFLPQAWLLAARAAFLDGRSDQAALILARLQSRYPDSAESDQAAANLRLLDRFRDKSSSYVLDTTFFGAGPKRFSSPFRVLVSANETVAIAEQKSYHLSPLGDPGQRRTTSSENLVDFARANDGGVVLVFGNRVAHAEGKVTYKTNAPDGQGLSGIKSAAVDSLGRVFVVDSQLKELVAFDRAGKLLKSLLPKAKLVRAYGASALALGGDSNTFHKYGADLLLTPAPVSGLRDIEDYCFDDFGNLYVLHDKGSAVSAVSVAGERTTPLNLKTGSFPLKQAQALAVDASGALYLADRRGGAVYRFQ